MARLLIGACLIGLTGCALAPTGSPGQLPAPRPPAPLPEVVPVDPLAAPSWPWSLADLPLGDFPGGSPWRNEAAVLAESHRTATPWVIPGLWRIASGHKLGISSHILEQTQIRPDPVASFVRPVGPLGGWLSSHYKVSVLALADRAPRGREAALLAWYQDVTHYVEIVAKPAGLEVWQADGAVPDHASGWTRLWHAEIPTAVGQVRRLGLAVDAKSGALGIYLDGHEVGEASAPLIPASGAAHTLALRSSGGAVYYGELKVTPQ